ncbi:reverse transcriptase-like protein [Plakobranchus ocellatus]|uniref:Reverse transcriptase-like protein n=1 Tax=Plakobranchus ocellatus TaxID=259542 RepID=A0AAV4A857_9GAST|nr:reverse transcriptase-like protein [Plakobranchus ocellatus]
MIEEFTAENDLSILNSGEQTFVHLAYHSTSEIDLIAKRFPVWGLGKECAPPWWEGSVVPIPKPGKDPSNYRPIALTSFLCKKLEQMVNDQLVYVLESRNLLSKSEPNLVASTFEHIENAKIKVNTIDNLHVQCPPPWEEHKVKVDISLTKQKKKIPVKLLYQKEFFRIKEKFSNHYAVFTDRSKLEKKVVAAAYFPERLECSKATRLRDEASVLSAELKGIASDSQK